jgi:hypothetical protein
VTVVVGLDVGMTVGGFVELGGTLVGPSVGTLVLVGPLV